MKLSKTEELFLKAYRYNWDDGIGALQKIIENRNCDRATALLIYWLARPVYYNKYNNIDEMPEYERPAYNLIKKIEELVMNDRLPEIISYEPDPGLIPLDIGRIPEKMTEPSMGEIDSQALIDNETGELKLLKACAEGDLETVKSMIDGGLDVNEKINSELPIAIAAIYGQAEVVEYLISKGANIKVKTGPDGFTLLHWACQAKHFSTARVLLENGLSVNVKAKWGRTGLHQFVHWQEKMWKECRMDEVLTFLLENGADMNITDSDGETPLQMAERIGNNAAVQFLKDWTK